MNNQVHVTGFIEKALHYQGFLRGHDFKSGHSGSEVGYDLVGGYI